MRTHCFFGVLAAFWSAAASLGQTFTDGTFFDSRWSSAKLVDTTPLGNATWSGIRGTGGNPGDCRVIAHNWQVVPAGVSLVIGHLSEDTTVDPAAGPAIVGIGWSFDARCDSAPLVGGIGFGPLLKQNGKWYAAPGGVAIVNAGWTALAGSAGNLSWTEIGGSGKPDLSPAGAAIEFGFSSSNGGSGTTLTVLASGKVDNFSVSIKRTCTGDLNADGQVDDADFVFFVAGYNTLDCADPTMPAGCPGDLNRDGFVDDADFVEFAAAYNELVCP